MRNGITLEQELRARIFLHKTAVLGGILMKDFMEQQNSMGGAQLPEFLLEDQAQRYSDIAMKKAFEEGTFNEQYENAWSRLVKVMPEHTKLIESYVV